MNLAKNAIVNSMLASQDNREIATILTTVLTVLGTLFVAFGAKFWDMQMEIKNRRETVANKYLSQLQESLESLWHRLNNVVNDHGNEAMSQSYRDITNLYAMASPLALERIFILEGVYAQIATYDPTLAKALQENKLDLQLKGLNFHRYHRMALAEAAIVSGSASFRLASLSEFKTSYQKAVSNSEDWVNAALSFPHFVPKPKLIDIMSNVEAQITTLVKSTKMSSAIPYCS